MEPNIASSHTPLTQQAEISSDFGGEGFVAGGGIGLYELGLPH